jgi:hypothetical protein
MIDMPNWITQIRHEKLFQWNQEPGFEAQQHHSGVNKYYRPDIVPGEPISVVYSQAKAIPTDNPFFTSIVWSSGTNKLRFIPDIGNHPNTIVFFDIKRFTDPTHGFFHHEDETKPAIVVSEVVAYWRGYNYCTQHGLSFRPGPKSITIKGYLEYWYEGEFIDNGWESISLQWWDRFSTKGPPHWEKLPKLENMLSPELELISMLQNTSKPVKPLCNNFFQSETDEFQFLNIIQNIK